MYIAGLHIPHSPTELAEPLIWSTILISHVRFGLRQRKTMVHADKTAGGIKRMPTSTLSRFVLPAHGLASLAAPAVYILALPFSGFRQPEWFGKFALPDFPALGEGGTLAVRLLAGVAVVSIFELAAGAMEHLGKQFHFFGVRDKPRIVDTGAYGIVRHPIYTFAVAIQLAYVPLFWSYAPLAFAAIATAAFVVKIPIEENLLVETDEFIAADYDNYKKKVPYRLIPYVW